MGLFENGMFANGTINIAKSMALAFWRGCKTLIGGGDTLEATRKAEVSEGEVSHVSTGGGDTLRFLGSLYRAVCRRMHAGIYITMIFLL
jgi:phosphoglycerate kinase